MHQRLENSCAIESGRHAVPPQPSSPPTAEAPASRTLVAAAESGNTADVLRLLRDHCPPGMSNDRSVRRALGEEAFAAAIRACAGMACPYCRKGFSTCGRCDGHGRVDGWIACAACATLGAIPCDFCGGSGLASYDFFPSVVRSTIAVTRASLATRRLSILLGGESTRRFTGTDVRVAGHRRLEHLGAVSRCRAMLAAFSDAFPDHPRPNVSEALALADADMARTLVALAAAARATSAAHGANPDRRAFYQGRSEALEELAAQRAGNRG